MAVIATDAVYNGAGLRLTLRGTGRSGGEGTVYEIEQRPLEVAKIYHPGRRTPEVRAKLEAMRASPPRDAAWDTQGVRSIAWVQELLFTDPSRTTVAGFTMPRIDDARYREAHLYADPQDRVPRFGGGFTWRHLLAVATNVASSVAAIHAQGHRIGDLSETNVLVAPDTRIALIDCDSFQIKEPRTRRTFHSRVGTTDFLPPELLGANFGDDHDRTYADRFALGVLIFKLLMGGVHPYQACGPRVENLPSIQAKIARGLYPYARRRGVEPPPFALPYHVLPKDLRRLFERCFVRGHRARAHRPTTNEWFETLKEAGKHLSVCSLNENHVHGEHLRRCPWCTLTDDPFPARGARRARFVVHAPAPRATPPPSTPSSVSVSSPSPSHRIRSPRLRITRRTALAAAVTTAVLALLASPVGHASSPERRSRVPLETTIEGPCPREHAAPAAAGCRARWTFGPATLIEQDTRRWFLVRRSTRHLDVAFSVRFDADTRCAVPWIDSDTFNERATSVCLAACTERIEMLSEAGTHPLIRSRGVASSSDRLRCGSRHRGGWRFDITDAPSSRITLRYPGLRAVPLRPPRATQP